MRPPQLVKPSPLPIFIMVAFWGPFALVFGALGILCLATIVGIPIGILALFIAAGPIALPIISYNNKVAAYNVATGNAEQQMQKPFRGEVKPWDVSIEADTSGYEGWYNDGGTNQASTRDGGHDRRGRNAR